MEILKKYIWILFLLIPSGVEACPMCAVSNNNGQFFNQRLVILGVMGTFPLVIAGFIGYKIYQLCQKPPQEDNPSEVKH